APVSRYAAASKPADLRTPPTRRPRSSTSTPTRLRPRRAYGHRVRNHHPLLTAKDIPMTTTRRTLLSGSAAVAATAFLSAPAAHAAESDSSSRPKPTVVLVHGAFADASGWNGVAARLIDGGYPVVAPANPLRSVSTDSAYLAGFLATITGPVIL